MISFTGSSLYRLPVGAVPVKLSRNPPSVVPVISPVLILEPSPEAFPLVGLLGVPVPVCTDYWWVLSCEETPSVVASDHPFLILEPPPEASPLVGLLGYRFQSCSCEAVKEPPFSGYQ